MLYNYTKWTILNGLGMRSIILTLIAVVLAGCGGGSSAPAQRTPSPPADTTPPNITLTGDDPQIIVAGDPYTELGAAAIDNNDGDISGSIVVDASAVDTTTVGDYNVTYNVVDSSGNAANTVTRIVRVLMTCMTVTAVMASSCMCGACLSWMTQSS